jgi:ribosomal protein S18 acetylase RimI-like enzyme
VRLLAVTPTAQGQGIGRSLMEECLARARGQGAAAMILHTTDMMQAAMTLYTKLGFVRAPELDFKPFPPEMEPQLDATLRDALIKGYRLALR